MVDWSGADYRRLSRLQDAVAADALAELPLRGDEDVLDIGCGDGRRTADIAARVPRGSVLGIDASPRMIAAAASLRRSGLDFACVRAQDLTAVRQFDSVVSINALHWLPEPQLLDVLARIRRALRRAGWALMQFVCASDEPSLEQVAMQVAASPQWASWFVDFPPPFTHPRPQQFANAVRAIGYEVRSCMVQRHVWPFPTRDAFVEWAAMGFGDWTARLPDDRAKLDFVREVVGAYCTDTGTISQFRFMQLRLMLGLSG